MSQDKYNLDRTARDLLVEVNTAGSTADVGAWTLLAGARVQRIHHRPGGSFREGTWGDPGQAVFDDSCWDRSAIMTNPKLYVKPQFDYRA